MKPLIIATVAALALISGAATAQTPRGDAGAPSVPVPSQPSPPAGPQVAPPSLPQTTPSTPPPVSPPLGTSTPQPPIAPQTGAIPPVDRPMTDQRVGGRISETAPSVQTEPLPQRGSQRFQQDLATCNQMQGDARATCRREMFAARAQGFYR